jgi:hypothetical protein
VTVHCGSHRMQAACLCMLLSMLIDMLQVAVSRAVQLLLYVHAMQRSKQLA